MFPILSLIACGGDSSGSDSSGAGDGDLMPTEGVTDVGNSAETGGSGAASGTGGGGQGNPSIGGAQVTTSGAGAGGASTSGGSGAIPTPGQCDEAGAAQMYAPSLFSEGGDPSAEPSCTDVLNPERGLRGVVDLRSPTNFDGARASGHSTMYGYVLIPEYIDKDLDSAVLDVLEDNFAAMRAAGIKVLLRVYYAPAEDPDAPLPQVLAHIAQLKPLLQTHSDVIAAMHAGFVGYWGEWHSSTNNLTAPAARKAIMDALLDALPADRMILARRPSHKEDAYGGPLTEESAYAGSSMSRIGHLNDCFLASESDFGTYANEAERNYARADSAFTVVEGETCAVNTPRSECPNALSELAAHHWSLLNIAYNGAVLDSWRSGGCFEEVACRLGYRYALLGHVAPEVVPRGEVLNVSVALINDGFARAFNPRPVYLVLEGPEAKREILVDLELRDLEPGVERTFCLGARIPEDLPPGDYRLGLWMPDAAPTLQRDERFAVRITNDVDWAAGVNFLDAIVSVQ